MEFNLIFKKVYFYKKSIKAKDHESAEEKAEEILNKQNEKEDSNWDLHSECDGWELEEIEES
jgi:hypothetical protein